MIEICLFQFIFCKGIVKSIGGHKLGSLVWTHWHNTTEGWNEIVLEIGFCDLVSGMDCLVLLKKKNQTGWRCSFQTNKYCWRVDIAYERAVAMKTREWHNHCPANWSCNSDSLFTKRPSPEQSHGLFDQDPPKEKENDHKTCSLCCSSRRKTVRRFNYNFSEELAFHNCHSKMKTLHKHFWSSFVVFVSDTHCLK